MANRSYLEIFGEYQAARNNLFASVAETKAERGGGAEGAVIPARADALIQKSGELREALTDVPDANPDLIDAAGLKLLAAAAYDLTVAQQVLDAEPGREEAERNAVIFLPAEIHNILKSPLEETFGRLDLERGILPTDGPSARKKLLENCSEFATEIVKGSANVGKAAVAGAINFGFGPASAAASFVSTELLKLIPDAASLAIRTAARLIVEAIQKIWAAFGKDTQKAVETQTKNWMGELWTKPEFTEGLLIRLYDADGIRQEVSQMVENAPESTDARNFNNASRNLEELLARHQKIGKTLQYLIRGMSFSGNALKAALPWGPLVAYGIYAGVFGYAVYLGSDYLDANPIASKWLDHVRGLRATVRSSLE